MSTLWNVKVVELGGPRVGLRVWLVHPDAGPFSQSAVFALRLLYDEAWEYNVQMERVARGPLGEEITPDNIEDARWMRANAGRFIADVALVEELRAPLDEQAIHRRIESALRERGLGPGDATWAQDKRAAWNVFWRDPDNLPEALYRITVTDPRWLAHLAPDQTWRSAAYD